MPAIEQIQIQHSTDTARARIQELKARAAEGLDDALSVVAKNFGREETHEAEDSLKSLGQDLAAQGANTHRLDLTRVMDLISDPFEDGQKL
ncbi:MULTISPECIES: hypothetical protein [unclassified Pseudodesulfovibrio]|uniref:hypothetical protein n=1 Tax=unclassified Pseudodesulfovibrio TaxID=2661612 RepID=UPI000FEC06B6|nr:MULTISPECIES: hypothetical protein [unclassified Pseudodesulfovibrio]MCJ2165192.1 hypothetical protein [Pseudodesulfovibrio sp. S3-i]RWU03359.1 hypothetical protein DWB63_11085 [Pseudodesulfovibrio sp. S3]